MATGDAGNMGDMLARAIFLLNKGYRVITFDYRGFGDSTDFKFEKSNIYHSEYVIDFVAVMKWAKENYKTEKIGVLAVSMGSFITAIGYGQSEYDFYIAEGFFTSPYKVQARAKEHRDKDVLLPVSAKKDEELANDAMEEYIQLSSIIGRNKHTLLYFWWSGCVPCREFNRSIDPELIENLKAGGIEIVSISTDESKARWIKASNKDSISWTNLHYGGDESVKLAYDVMVYPTKHIVDTGLSKVDFDFKNATELVELAMDN